MHEAVGEAEGEVVGEAVGECTSSDKAVRAQWVTCYVTPGRRQLWQYVGNVTTGNFALTAAALQRVAKRTDPLDLIAGETKR